MNQTLSMIPVPENGTNQFAKFVDVSCTAKIVDFKPVSASFNIQIESSMLVFNNPTGHLILAPLVAPSDDGLAMIFTFTVNDLFNNRITRSHNFNTEVVDVTLIDPNGRIVNCETIITRNTVSLNLIRIPVSGTWKFLVERL